MVWQCKERLAASACGRNEKDRDAFRIGYSDGYYGYAICETWATIAYKIGYDLGCKDRKG